jgi:hypothetical protein
MTEVAQLVTRNLQFQERRRSKLLKRGQFERLLVLRLDKVRVGTAHRAKRLIGVAWRATIDDMYERHAEQLSVNEFAPVVTECADAIVRLAKGIKD